MWILIGVMIGLVAGGVLLVAMVVARNRSGSPSAAAALTADQWLTLGIVFSGVGAALMATIGVWMVGMVAIGVIYLGIGISMKRSSQD